MKALIFFLLPLGSLAAKDENCTDDFTKLKHCEHEAVIEVSYGSCGGTYKLPHSANLEKPNITWTAGGEADEKKYFLLMDSHDEEHVPHIVWFITELKGSDLKQSVISGTDKLSFDEEVVEPKIIHIFLFEHVPNEIYESVNERKGYDINKVINEYHLCKKLVGTYEIKVESGGAKNEEDVTTHAPTEAHEITGSDATGSPTILKIETLEEASTQQLENFTTTTAQVKEVTGTEGTAKASTEMAMVVKDESAHLRRLDGLLLLSAILCGALRGWIG